MKAIAITLMLAAAMQAAEPQIVFDKQSSLPGRGIPKEATLQEKGTGDVLRPPTLAKVLGDSMKSVTGRYSSDVWTEKALRDYLAGLMADETTSAYTFQIWSQVLGVPEVECSLAFKNQKDGKLLLWNSCCCIRDSQGRWWFVTLSDYYRKNHPHGTQTKARKQ